MISHAFVCSSGNSVRVLSIDGASPVLEPDAYPSVRPLYLLWRPGNPAVEAYLDWAVSPAADPVIEKCFRRARTTSPVTLHRGRPERGSLVDLR